MKKGIMISIDEDLHKKAKQKIFNISELCENVIREKTQGSVDQPEETRECFKCGSQENLFWDGTFLYWICEKCLNGEIKILKANIIAKK